MAHYAFLDENNIVTEVIVGKDETELIDGLIPEEWYGNYRGQRCVHTSYNNNIRKQYAGIGYTYDATADVFIAPKPFEPPPAPPAITRYSSDVTVVSAPNPARICMTRPLRCRP